MTAWETSDADTEDEIMRRLIEGDRLARRTEYAADCAVRGLLVDVARGLYVSREELNLKEENRVNG